MSVKDRAHGSIPPNWPGATGRKDADAKTGGAQGKQGFDQSPISAAMRAAMARLPLTDGCTMSMP